MPSSESNDGSTGASAAGVDPGGALVEHEAEAVDLDVSARPAGAVGAGAVGAGSLGAVAIGALAIGALAVGAVAIGRLAIGRLTARDAHFDRLSVGRLQIGAVEPYVEPKKKRRR